jgi:hypothetical protein
MLLIRIGAWIYVAISTRGNCEDFSSTLTIRGRDQRRLYLESWTKAMSAIGELVNIRKELGASSHKEGVERCAQAQMRDRA